MTLDRAAFFNYSSLPESLLQLVLAGIDVVLER